MTPEDPYPVWRGARGPVTVAPLFLLYDYSFRVPGAATRDESLAVARAAGIVCTDEHLLHPEPYPSRDAWCRARVAWPERRLAAVPEAHRTVLVNHYPLVREPTRMLRHPEFAQWCGTELTADWHRRFRAAAVVYGHLHIPRVTWHDGVGFEEVSLGYPGERRARPARALPRAVLPEPAGPGAGGPGPSPGVSARATLLERLLPGQVAVAETFTDEPAPAAAQLHPEEAEVISRQVPRRRREFTTVRQCARRAMGAFGIPPTPLLPDRRGAPQWPPGLVGAMTHCPGYRAAAVAPRSETACIGIDAEPNEPLPEGLLDTVALDRERSRLAAHSRAAPGVCFDRLLFSAKEAVFKVWYPLTRRELGFDGALVDIAPETGTFTARLLTATTTPDGQRLDTLTGRWLSRDGLLVTAIALPPPPLRRAPAAAAPACPPAA